jgi:hypothetical protein
MLMVFSCADAETAASAIAEAVRSVENFMRSSSVSYVSADGDASVAMGAMPTAGTCLMTNSEFKDGKSMSPRRNAYISLVCLRWVNRFPALD